MRIMHEKEIEKRASTLLKGFDISKLLTFVIFNFCKCRKSATNNLSIAGEQCLQIRYYCQQFSWPSTYNLLISK